MIIIKHDKAKTLTDEELKKMRDDFTGSFLEHASQYLKDYPENTAEIELLSYGINALILESESMDRIIAGYHEQIKKVLGNMALTEKALGKDPVKS